MKRPEEIATAFLRVLDQHMDDLKWGKADKAFEVQDMAALLHMHPTHLSNTIRQELKQSPCAIYEEKLMAVAKERILTTNHSIAAIARHLTFDPSNFNKFFKHFAGMTPKTFREMHR